MHRKDSNTEMAGVYKAAMIFTVELEWIFRAQYVVDVGIDAIVEKSNKGNPQGKFIAVQIKCGAGNFYNDGEFYTYYISNWHYHYWSNSNLPVILVAHFPKSGETIWEHLSEEKIERTKTQWKLKFQKAKRLIHIH